MNLFSTNDRKTDLKIRINRGRYNLIFFVLTSVINIFLITTGSQMILPYSSAISNYSVALGIAESLKSANDSLRVLGLVIACTILMALALCYILSKNKPFYLVIAISLIVADTAALAIIEGVNGTLASPLVILDIVIHALAVFYIASGIKASKELQTLPAEETTSHVTSDNNVDNQTEYQNNSDAISESFENDYNADNEYDNENVDDADLTQPIGKYIDDGTEPLVQGTYNGLKVFVVIRNNIAELVINGFVCDEFDTTNTYEFQLRAFVNDIDFTFDYKETEKSEIMYLYADNVLLDSLGIG